MALLAWMQSSSAHLDIEGLRGAGKHRSHGKLYGTEKGFRDLVDWAQKQERIELHVETPMPFFSGEPAPSLEQFVAGMLCRSDAVLQGQVLSKASFLTENREWVFTDYEFKIEEVLNVRPGISVEPESIVTVTRTGGELRIGKSVIRVSNASYKPLQIGSTYLLFLTYLPDTGSFTSRLSRAAFLVQGRDAVALTSEATPAEQPDATALREAVRSAHWSACAGGLAQPFPVTKPRVAPPLSLPLLERQGTSRIKPAGQPEPTHL